MKFEGSKSCIAIMTAAKTLFWKHGIKRITVEEICKEAGVSKMTFYRNFKNKIELARKLMMFLFDKGMEEYRDIMMREIPFCQKVKLTIDLERKVARDVSEEFIRDVHAYDLPELKQLIDAQMSIRNEAMVRDFAEAQKNGWIRKDLNLEFTLYTLNDLATKISDDRFLAIFDNAEDAVSEMTNHFFYGILSNQNK